MMTITKEYGKEYVNLKHRINLLRIKPLYPRPLKMNETTVKYIEYVNLLAKELDILYSDERYFDEIEDKVRKLEEIFN